MSNSMSDRAFTHRFIHAAQQYPRHTAIKAGGVSVNYEELLRMVKTMMRLVEDHAVGETRLGVADQNDVLTYATFIAINLVGKTYVPLSTRGTSVRNAAILEQANVKLVFSSTAFSCGDIRVVLTGSKSHSAEHSREITISSSSEPAYILFTSGSTGVPKGVPVMNKHLNAFFDFFLNRQHYDFSPADRFLQVYEAGFDVSVFSAFTPLFSGGSVYLIPRRNFPHLEIPQLLLDEEITVLSMVPTVLHYLHPYFPELQFEKLRYSFFSGDKLFQSHALAWSECIPNARIVNCYGPTETTIVCTQFPWSAEAGEEQSLNGVVPLGKLFPGMDYLVLTETEQEANENEQGELCLAGKQVISSYLNNQEAHRFLKYTKNGKEMVFYRSGDRVHVNTQGNLVFHGRTDTQVKINGYRVEPGEIEAVLARITGIHLNAVVACDTAEGLQSLVAFVEGAGNADALREQLAAHLPHYLLPKSIRFVESMPLTPNGKIDKQKLLSFV
jgi:D-alanine--poly(phosphoribitol) ligase subunit 1